MSYSPKSSVIKKIMSSDVGDGNPITDFTTSVIPGRMYRISGNISAKGTTMNNTEASYAVFKDGATVIGRIGATVHVGATHRNVSASPNLLFVAVGTSLTCDCAGNANGSIGSGSFILVEDVTLQYKGITV